MRKHLLQSLVAAGVTAVAVALALPAQAADPDPYPAKAGAEKAKELRMHGTIESIDLDARTLTLKESTGSKTFRIATDTEFVLKDNPKAAFSDLKVGDSIEVFYTEDGGTFSARRVSHWEAKGTETK